MSTTPFHSRGAASQATRCSRSIDFARWPLGAAAALALSASSFASPSIQGALPPTDLFESLRSFELLAVAPPAGNPEEFIVDVQTAEFAWTLSLKRHSVWAPDARMTLIGEDGVRRSFPMAPSRTYRGEVLELPGSTVSAVFTVDGFTAMVEAPGIGRRTLEPTGLGDGLTVFYGPEDLVPVPSFCGAPTLEDLRRDPREPPSPSHRPKQPGGVSPTLPGGGAGTSAAQGGESYIAELAIDADYEYFLALNSSPSQVQNRIAQVMNSVDLRYERDLNITHVITELVIRTSSNDPYTSTDVDLRLGEMRAWWEANQTNVDYDVAHLFSGIDFDGGFVGAAYPSRVCTSFGYGVNQRHTSFNEMVDLLTHELGHNWGAGHCNDANSCDTSLECNYMCSTLLSCDNQNVFGPCAQSAINAFRGTLTGGGCIETTASPVLWVKLAQNCPFSCSGTHGAPYRQLGQVVAAVPAGGQLRNVRVFAGTTLSSGETWPIIIDRPMTIDVFRGLGADPSGVVTIERP